MQRIDTFNSYGFGLFLHFGLYSLIGEGEWYLNYNDIEADEYAQLAKKFSAEGFDADAICKMAKDAGCRYVCLTTRHHEGFSLYDTRGLNTYDAPHSPAGRDLIAEYSTACEKYGLGKFFYHTTLDWWHPDFDTDWDAYQKYLRDSIDLLCTHYGKVDGFWFDGNWARRERDWQEHQLYAVIRAKQPEAIIINNSSHGHHGQASHPEVDVVTYEQGLPAKRSFDDRPRGGEMCETMNGHWGVGAHDIGMKSPGDIITRLAACRRYRANLLLNIGPEASGAIPAYEQACFELIGRWSRMAGEALYDGQPTQLVCRHDDFVLQVGANYYYYFCHNVPIHGNRHLLRGEPGDGLQTAQGPLAKVQKISWLDQADTDLAFTQDGERLMFHATPFPYGSQMVVRVAKIETVGS